MRDIYRKDVVSREIIGFDYFPKRRGQHGVRCHAHAPRCLQGGNLSGEFGGMQQPHPAARPPESEYQKQNLRHCCGGKLPPMVSMSSTGQEMPSPWFIRIILTSIFLASASPIATNF